MVDVVREDPLVLQMEHFGAVVRGEAEPLVSVRDGLANLRVTEAIAQAARTGRVVELPIVFVDRKVGESKMTNDIVVEAMKNVWKLRFSPPARARGGGPA